MSVDSKYYIPEMEELFLGYECEADDHGEGYDKVILNLDSFNRMWTLRTKYLDEEDILSEGFVKCSSFEFKKESTYGVMMIDNVYDEGFINISFIDHLGTELDVFYGRCPSINELRKILKLVTI